MPIRATILSLLLLARLSWASSSVRVASSREFLDALLDGSVHTVEVSGSFALRAEDWPAPAKVGYLHVNRDVSLLAVEGHKTIDLGFRRPTVAVGNGATLQVRGIHFARSADYSEESHAASSASEADNLVPFFTFLGNGELLFKDVSAEVVEKGLLHLHVEHLSSSTQNATIVGEETCLSVGVDCPLGAVWIEGDVRKGSSSLDKFGTDVYDCLHVLIPSDRRDLKEDEEEAVVESLVELHIALRDKSVAWIYLAGDIVFETKGWPNTHGTMENVVSLSRNASIISHPWVRPHNGNPALWDLDLKLEKLKISDNAQLRIKGVTLLKSMGSSGNPADIGFFVTSSRGQIVLEEVVVEAPSSRDVLDHVKILRSSTSYQHVNLTGCNSAYVNDVHACKGVIKVNGAGSGVEDELMSLPGARKYPMASIAFDLVTFVLVDQSIVTTKEEKYMEQGIRIVDTELELLEALENNQIRLIYLSQNLYLSEGVWGSNYDESMKLDHSVVLTSHPGAVMLVLDFNSLEGRVQPSEGVVVRLQSLDLDTLKLDINTPEITVPFFSLEAGGALSIVDVLAFTEVRKELGPLVPPEPNRPVQVDIVSNDRCRQLAGLSCVDKAMHVQQWSSFASTKRTDANGEVSVKNMLIVAIRELGIEEVRHVSTSPKKGRAWTSAAIGLGIATAILLIMLVAGAVYVMWKRSPAKNSSLEQNQSKGKHDYDKKKSPIVTSIHVDSTEQAAAMPPTATGDIY